MFFNNYACETKCEGFAGLFLFLIVFMAKTTYNNIVEREKNMISVAMAFYNGAAYVEEQVDSILDNLQVQDELIISVDDDSDGSKEILERIADEDTRVKLVKGPGQGVVPNFVNAIEHCSGEIIFLADQDDVWTKNKVKTVMESFEDSKVMAVVHNAKIVDGKLNDTGETTFAWRDSGAGFWKNIKKNSYIGCCLAFRKKILPRVLPIPEKVWMHDQWIGLLAEQLGKVDFVKEDLLLYRRHEENVTGLRHGSLISMVKKRYHMIIEINKRVKEWKGK